MKIQNGISPKIRKFTSCQKYQKTTRSHTQSLPDFYTRCSWLLATIYVNMKQFDENLRATGAKNCTQNLPKIRKVQL